MGILDPFIGVPVQAAFVGGAFLAMGWIVNGWQNRRDAATQRAERTRDVHRALYAEIGTNLANLWDEQTLDTYAQSMIVKMQEPSFVPFIPLEQNDHLYEKIAADIHILPRQTIDPIVTYYVLIRSISALATDMRAEGFSKLSVERRTAMYSDYIEMKKQALAFGRYANAMITAYASGGAGAADAEAARIATVNSPVAVRSGPSQE
jgi:hypothetical protein